MASKSRGSPAPRATRTQRPAGKNARLCTGATEIIVAVDRTQGRAAKRNKSEGGQRVLSVDWTLPAPLAITRRELEVLEQHLRTYIDEILRM